MAGLALGKILGWLFKLCFFTICHRCDIHITGSATVNIDIQVELEVVNVAFSNPSFPHRAMIILCVMINRPCQWAGNNSKQYSDLSIQLIHFPIRQNLAWINRGRV